MFVFNKLNRFICIRLSNANKIQTINPEIMNKTTRLLGSLLIITIATSCGTGDKNQSAQTDDPLANSPIVGQYVQAGTDKVMSCDQKLLADTVRIPLSFFTEKLEIVKLDINPAKRKAMAVKNEKRFLKQKRNALKNPGYSHHPVKTQASFKRLLKAV